MTTIQQYYGTNFDNYNHSTHRTASTTGCFDRAAPYAWHDHPRHRFRPDQTFFNEPVVSVPEPLQTSQNQETEEKPVRRRIQVAISAADAGVAKSGAPAKWTVVAAVQHAVKLEKVICVASCGCVASMAAGEKFLLTSEQVQSEARVWVGNHGAPASRPSIASMEAGPSTDVNGVGIDATGARQSQQRPSLPLLTTRTGRAEYNQHAYGSEFEGYGYSSYPFRHDSMTSGYNGNGEGAFRLWGSGSGLIPLRTSSVYYGPDTSFPHSIAPTHPTLTVSSIPRLSSATSESLSALDLSSIQSSLPSQTVQTRRLPTPRAETYQQQAYVWTEPPHIRPLAAHFDPTTRSHFPGIQVHHPQAWVTEAGAIPAYREGLVEYVNTGMSMPLSSQSSSSTLSAAEYSNTASTSSAAEYSNTASTSSSDVSPTTVPTLAERFANAGMPPNASSTMAHGPLEYYTTHDAYPSTCTMSPCVSLAQPSATHVPAQPSLFSYSAESTDDHQSNQNGSRRPNIQPFNQEDICSAVISPQIYSNVRQTPVPRRRDVCDEVDGPRAVDEQRQRALTEARLRLSNLDTKRQ